jgi:DNA phosphorothioation-dependent restriction protein DptG
MIKKMTEIEKVKAEIKVLEKKVALLEELEEIKKKKETENLTDLIYDWWEDIFTSHSNLDMEASIDDLVTRIDEWLPKEQSAAGSQNVYVECTVEGFNDCLNKIKRKLR